MKQFKLSKDKAHYSDVYLTIERYGEHNIQIVAVDEHGSFLDNGMVAIVGLDGIYRCRGLNPHLGFAQDDDRRLLEIT